MDDVRYLSDVFPVLDEDVLEFIDDGALEGGPPCIDDGLLGADEPVELAHLTEAELNVFKRGQEAAMRDRVPEIERELRDLLSQLEIGDEEGAERAHVHASSALAEKAADEATAFVRITELIEALRRRRDAQARSVESLSSDSDSESPHRPTSDEDALLFLCTRCADAEGKYFLWNDGGSYLCYSCVVQLGFRKHGIAFPCGCFGEGCEKTLGFAPGADQPYLRQAPGAGDGGAAGQAMVYAAHCRHHALLTDFRKHGIAFPCGCFGEGCEKTLGFAPGADQPYLRQAPGAGDGGAAGQAMVYAAHCHHHALLTDFRKHGIAFPCVCFVEGCEKTLDFAPGLASPYLRQAPGAGDGGAVGQATAFAAHCRRHALEIDFRKRNPMCKLPATCFTCSKCVGFGDGALLPHIWSGKVVCYGCSKPSSGAWCPGNCGAGGPSPFVLFRLHAKTQIPMCEMCAAWQQPKTPNKVFCDPFRHPCGFGSGHMWTSRRSPHKLQYVLFLGALCPG